MTLIPAKDGSVIKILAHKHSAISESLAPSDAVQLAATPLIDFTTGLS